MYESDRELRGEWATMTANDLGRIADVLERLIHVAERAFPIPYDYAFAKNVDEFLALKNAGWEPDPADPGRISWQQMRRQRTEALEGEDIPDCNCQDCGAIVNTTRDGKYRCGCG